MKILVVEDSDGRISLFKEWVSCGIDYAETSEKAIELLKKNTYDLVMLDHDLGGKAFQESDDDTGYGVAKFMQQNNIKSDVVVHSVNPVGADNIKGVLPHAHLMPFGTFELIPTIEDGQLKSLKIQPMEAF